MTRWSWLAAVALMAGGPGLSAGQDVTAIRAGRLVDVEKGQIRRDQIILVRGDRIESIQPASSRIPSGARVVDLSKYTVLPGLIDCHAHLIGEAELSDVLLPLERSAAQEAFSGVRNARATLLAGFTTVRDVGTYRAFVDAALRDAIEDGTVIGPRMAVAGAYVTVTKGAGEVVGAANDVTIPADFRLASRTPWTRSGSGYGRCSMAGPTSSRFWRPARC